MCCWPDGAYGNDPNLLAATEAAHGRRHDGGGAGLTAPAAASWPPCCGETDVLISVPHDRAARVREVHTLVLLPQRRRGRTDYWVNRRFHYEPRQP